MLKLKLYKSQILKDYAIKLQLMPSLAIAGFMSFDDFKVVA